MTLFSVFFVSRSYYCYENSSKLAFPLWVMVTVSSKCVGSLEAEFSHEDQ